MNEGKTQHLLCTLRRGDNSAGQADKVKLLGFWVDPELNWRDHTDNVCTKLSRVLHLLRRLKYTINPQFLVMVYHALMHSHINYGLIWWGHATGCRRVLAIQKKAVRLITGSGYRDHCRPLFTKTGILTIYSQYCLSTLISLKDDLPKFQLRGEIHNHATRHGRDIDLPRCRLKKTSNSYPMSAVKLYNMLPSHVKSLDSNKMEAMLRKIFVNKPLYSLDEIDVGYFLTPPPSSAL
uniref:Uncharacterized protein n=1 Tax=Cuerna arida TaxID=1464854 RepID=A0A1B6G101_9HEMI